MKKLIYILILSIVFYACQKKQYYKNSGQVFGTFYHIQYQSNQDYQTEINSALESVNQSLSTFDPKSVISKVNKNEPCELDKHFVTVFKKGKALSKLTDGAFDMTVSSLVNAWGFGFKTMEFPDSTCIDSLMQFVGYQNLEINHSKIVKKASEYELDASAIAKGYGVDIVADLLESYHIKNYLVEIGGEIRLKGVNSKNKEWTVGIDIPEESALRMNNNLQDVISIGEGAIATSGNYRQFYYKKGQRYAHTINPKTGYPVNHNLLSATIVAKDCITADALATATMVMGLEEAQKLSKKLKDTSFYLIYAIDSTTNEIWYSDSFKSYIKSNSQSK